MLVLPEVAKEASGIEEEDPHILGGTPQEQGQHSPSEVEVLMTVHGH